MESTSVTDFGADLRGELHARTFAPRARLSTCLAFVAIALACAFAARAAPTVVYRVDRVTDGDTAVLRNGQRVRLVQIDSVAVVFGAALAA